MPKTTGAIEGQDATGATAAEQTDSCCPGCGKTFSCGADGGSCWCMQFAARLSVPAEPGARCLCPDCLARRIGDPAA